MNDETLRAAERAWDLDRSPEAEEALAILRARAGLCPEVERVQWFPTYGPVGRSVGGLADLFGEPGRHPAGCSACSAHGRKIEHSRRRGTWRARARVYVDLVLAALPADADLRAKRKALREERGCMDPHAPGIKAWREASTDALGLPSKRNGTRAVPVGAPLFGAKS